MQREDLENDFPFFVPDSIFGIELARNLYEEFGDMIRLNGNDKASRRRFGSFLNNIKTVYTTAMHETKSTYDREIATMAKV
ncbi:hypothetical protein BDD12DRAFT_111849 [Trichophaea hybrida]|nr:hypothetical protein BDD12DRAFT_111849 [Trichophaea hybrida]